jgi:outer membrane protein
MRKSLILIIIMISSIFLVAEVIDLEAAWQILLKNNLQLCSEKLTRDNSLSDVKQATRNLLPTGNLGGSYGLRGDELDNESIGFSVSLSQNLFQGGKFLNNYRSSRKALTRSEYNYEALLLSLRMQLETKYYAVIESDENLQISRQEQKYNQVNLSAAELRYENGTISYGELLQLRSTTAQQEVMILKAENQYQIAINDLKNFLLIEDDLILSGKALSDYQSELEKLGKLEAGDLKILEMSLMDYAAENNPEYLRDKINVEISELELNSAKGNFLPSLSLSISRGWNYDNWGDNPEGSLSLGVSASLPVFSGYDNYLNYAKTRNSKSQVLITEEQSKRAMNQQIQSGLLNLVAAVMELRAAERAREYAQVSYETAEERFRNNMITANELLNTQTVMQTAESNLNSAIYSFLRYKCALQQNLGIIDETDLWELLF